MWQVMARGHGERLRCDHDAMEVVSALDIAAGLALGAVGVVALPRAGRAQGWLLLAASASWFIGSFWAPAGLAHRVPLVLALAVGVPWSQRRSTPLLIVGLGTTAVLTGVLPAPWTTAALGVVVLAAAWWQRGASGRMPAAATVLGIALIAVAGMRAGAVSPAATSVSYSLAVLVVAALLLRDLLAPPALDVIVRLADADADADALTPRLRSLLGDTRVDVVIGAFRPEPRPGTAVVPLRRGDAVVGYLRHSIERRPEPRVVDGLAALVGLVAEARELRARSQLTLSDLDAAHEDFRTARARRSADLGHELRGKPLEHLALARSRISDATLVAELDRATAELESMSRDLEEPVKALENWRSALSRRIEFSPIPIVARLLPDHEEIPGAVGHDVLLGCSEALSNAGKHSRATSIRLALALRDDVLTVEVADDGVGGADARGSGLAGLRERMQRRGGDFELDSPAGSGTVVRFWLPCGEAP